MNFKVTIETEEGRKVTSERNVTIDVVMLNDKKTIEALLVREAANGAMLAMRTLFKPLSGEKK